MDNTELKKLPQNSLSKTGQNFASEEKGNQYSFLG